LAGSIHPNSPWDLVMRFARANKAAIASEMGSLGNDNPAGRWVLDLSTTCLDGILASWGETLNEMRVICDSSKPLEEMQQQFQGRVGFSGEKQYIEIGGRRKLLTYSLAEPISFRKSREIAGLQIADVIASATSYAMKNQDDKDGNSWLQMIDASGTVHDRILPDAERANVNTREGMLNFMLLIELVDRAEKGRPLLAGIESFYAQAKSELPKLMRKNRKS
jgi:hypothetical protein